MILPQLARMALATGLLLSLPSCGGIASGFDPITLCRPPEIGSSLDAAKLSSMSHVGVCPGTDRARCSWNAFER